jgi:rhomboid protease GluP
LKRSCRPRSFFSLSGHTYADGYAFTILCIVDRETNPQAAFSLDVDQVRRIGEACLKYTGKINRAKMPVSIGIVEVGPGSADQPQRLGLLKRSSLRAKVLPFAVTADTASGEVEQQRELVHERRL